MKKLSLMILALCMFIFMLVHLVLAQGWIVREDGGGSYTMRPQDSSDPSKTYRGEVGSDGYIRMRSPDGGTLSGYVDQNGTMRLRDEAGNPVQVRPH